MGSKNIKRSSMIKIISAFTTKAQLETVPLNFMWETKFINVLKDR
jgi:hypothetical protein